MQNDIEQKQTYLRQQIIQKNYPGQQFAQYLLSLRANGGDLQQWTLKQLMQAVKKFQNIKQNEQKAQIQRQSQLQIEQNKRTQQQSSKSKQKSQEQDFKKFPQIFYAKYNLYDQSFRKTLKCQKAEGFIANLNNVNFQVIIDKPEIRKTGGIFGFGGVNKLWFAIRNNIANKEVMRADQDFEWLRNTYLRLFPGKMIPPLQGIRQTSIEDKIAVQIRMNMIKRFLEAVHKDMEIFNTQLTINFLTIDSKNMEVFKKKINGINSIRVLSAMSSETGFIQTQISPINQSLLEAANSFSQKSSKIYGHLKMLSSAISKSYEQLTNNIYKFGEGFAQLQQAYSRSIQKSVDLLNPKLTNTFINLNNMLVELGRSYSQQRHSMQKNFSYFFRFNKLQSQNACLFFQNRHKIQQQYLIFKSNLLKRKQQVYFNPNLWQLPNSFLQTIKPQQLSKQEAMKIIFPKQTDKQNRLKDWISFINKRLELSYKKLLDDSANRYIQTFKCLSYEFEAAHKMQQNVYSRMNNIVAD